MKVAFFLFFPPTIWAPGGGAVQVDRSKAALEKVGVEVSLFNPWERSRDFDLLHVFGSNHEIAGFVESAKGLGIPTVVSAISYSADRPWAQCIVTRASQWIPLTTVAGLRRQLLRRADVVIAASKAEAAQVQSQFGIDGRTLRVVHSGIDPERFTHGRADEFRKRYGLTDFVLQVGRVRRDKGQSRLIRALDGVGLPLVIIGPKDPTDRRGVKEFEDLLHGRPWVHYLGPIPHNDPLLPSAFKAARVHALPSSSESLGLVTLEAAAADCAVVTGPHPPIVEYLGHRAHYFNPNSEASIRQVVEKAYKSGPDPALAEFVRKRYSWESVGVELKAVYVALLEQMRRGSDAR